MLIDTHCHLSDKQFEGDLEIVVKSAVAEGVEKIIVPATSVEDAKKVLAMVAGWPELWAVVGIHPEEVIAGLRIKPEEVRAKLEGLMKGTKKVVGIGEIGLDFYWDKEKKTRGEQMELLATQVKLAQEKDLPVVIHMREAEEEVREGLDKVEGLRGQFHCWSGGREFLEWVLGQGFYVSFGGNVTFKRAEALRDLVKIVPPERLLLETDAPYLTPEPKRGQRNEPKNVKITAQFLAAWRGISSEELAQVTSKNAEKLFLI